MNPDALPKDIDDDLRELSHGDLCRLLTKRRRMHDALDRVLTATRKELDRANAEIVRLRTDLVNLHDLTRSK